MFETIAVIVSLGLIMMAVRMLAGGSDFATGLFPAQDQPGWPRGVQEEDVPRFVFGRAG